MRPKPSQHPGAGPVRPRDDETPPLFGVHAVEAALRNPRRKIHRLYATENAERRLADVLRDRGIEIERVSPRDLDRRLGADTVHQGVLLEVEPLPDVSLEDLAAHAVEGPLVALDQVTDPHNVGAVLRSAAVFGASGLILTRRHSPPLGGTLAKSASGALDLVPVALVANLARALDELGEAGITRIGLDGAGPSLLEDEPLKQPTVLVLGAEGRGLRQLTRETCDRLCRILSSGAIGSLNVSNAAAVALHVCAMQRRGRSPSL
jgi:23S rRNA (guanosine2251-2'-O)-methyltransferase